MQSMETPGKKDFEKKKAQKKKEKEERRLERKAHNNKGKGLDDMLAYIDEDGNIVDTPPDPLKKKEINVEDIVIGAARQVKEERETNHTGTITYFNDAKGYGFIQDAKTRESVFVHINQIAEPIKERDRVSYETEAGPKGLNAVRVKKI